MLKWVFRWRMISSVTFEAKLFQIAMTLFLFCFLFFSMTLMQFNTGAHLKQCKFVLSISSLPVTIIITVNVSVCSKESIYMHVFFLICSSFIPQNLLWEAFLQPLELWWVRLNDRLEKFVYHQYGPRGSEHSTWYDYASGRWIFIQ